jgi:hypothetical protein
MDKIDRLTKILLAALVIGVWALLIQSAVGYWRVEAQTKQPLNKQGEILPVLKVRGLVVVDEQNRERIVLGTPIPDTRDGKRVMPMSGMAILDTEGYERLGAGMMDDGKVVVGLDAPRGKGDDRNRERIHLVADGDGGAMIRFLNRKTGVPGWLRLGDDDKLYLEFLDIQKEKNKIFRRKIGFTGEETTEEPFK